MKRRDRLGVLGPNRSGKTTLLDVIAGRTAPDRGRVVRGETVVVGYYDQEMRDVDPAQRAIDYVSEAGGRVETAAGDTITAGSMLERFLVPPERQYSPVETFSGGERRRLFLVRILMAAPNVLLLDEPTNDLDVETLVRLEEYLDSFPGCVVVVSHDRYFLDRTVEHVFHFEGDGRVRGYAGGYSAFREAREREAAESAEVERGRRPKPAAAAAPAPVEGPRKLSFKERTELESLEARIDAAEARKVEIEAEIARGGSDHVALLALTRELESLEAALARDVDRWGELAERA
jgi:ATP-binding cassette subfamily F protein uup